MTVRERITPQMEPKEIIEYLRSSSGYFLTNNERDVSQSDFKGRILPQTTLKAAPYRDDTGYFSFEISGGASIHLDMLYKQINPFEKLRLVREAMPNTLIQILCRGWNLFGYRPYSENVIRMTVRLFSQYVDIWRIFDFLNHIPNLKIVGEEAQKANKLLMPCLCLGLGKEHTEAFYVQKVQEIVQTFGPDIILCLKNNSALGSPHFIASLFRAFKYNFPDLVLAYHGHNTDGNDLSRAIASVENGAKIVEVADHGFGGTYSQLPALGLVQTLNDYGYKAPGLKVIQMVNTSDILRKDRREYERFESPYRGFDPTIKRHRLTSGATSLAYEQLDKLDLLDRCREVFAELDQIKKELGNIWSATPGSQILWATGVNNCLYGRYERPPDDLTYLLLGRYGPFPFYSPEEWIYKKVLEKRRKDGKKWYKILADEGGIWHIPETDLQRKRLDLEKELGQSVSDEVLCLYLQFPRDALKYFQFENLFGKTWLLPPSVWFKRGGFENGKQITFTDEQGKPHQIEFISTRQKGKTVDVSLLVDFHFQSYSVPLK